MIDDEEFQNGKGIWMEKKGQWNWEWKIYIYIRARKGKKETKPRIHENKPKKKKRKEKESVNDSPQFGLVWFYGISTFLAI